MAYSTDKDNVVLFLRACYNGQAIRSVFRTRDERRFTNDNQKLCRETR